MLIFDLGSDFLLFPAGFSLWHLIQAGVSRAGANHLLERPGLSTRLGGGGSFQTCNALCSGIGLLSGSPQWGAQCGILINPHVCPPGVEGTRGEPWLLLNPPGSWLAPPRPGEHSGSAWVSSLGKDMKPPGDVCAASEGEQSCRRSCFDAGETGVGPDLYRRACLHTAQSSQQGAVGNDVTVQCVCGGWRFGGRGQLTRYIR